MIQALVIDFDGLILDTEGPDYRAWQEIFREHGCDLYLAVLQHLGVPAGEALAFEDSPNGIAAAKAAGMFCVAVPNRLPEGLDVSRADMCLRSLTQISLPELLGRLADRSPEAHGASGRSAGP